MHDEHPLIRIVDALANVLLVVTFVAGLAVLWDAAASFGASVAATVLQEVER